MPQEASEENQNQQSAAAEQAPSVTLDNLNQKISEWTKILRNGASLVAERGPDEEPFKNIYAAIENVTKLRDKVQQINTTNFTSEVVTFYVNFALIHIHSSLAKWLESCDELSQADKEHVQLSTRCTKLIGS